jgi:signal transduction histidine kinase
MTLRRLKRITIASALGFIVLLELVRRALGPFLPLWQGRLLMSAVIFLGSLFFFGALFSILERIQGKLERRNRELLALHEATLDVSGDLAVEKVLQKVVDQARFLVDARYGALSVIDDKNRIESFLTSGVTDEERARIGDPPVGHGLLGVVLHEGHRLRLADISRDPRSHGFPPNHPPMRSLLAVPLPCMGPFRGNLYLAEKSEGAEFTPEDQESLERFAATAAIAIDNAHLHQRLNELAVAQERLRIAHEMHDGLAQVLAYVNTKAQAVREFLRTGRTEEAARHLDQLAGAAREVYADVRESIIGLRSVAVPGRSTAEALQEYARTWETQTGIPCRLRMNGLPRLSGTTELQLLRIVQECLANVRKHAGASEVDVTVEQAGGRLRLAVQDDGSGFNPAAPGRSEFPRFGLSTMRERAESIGGAFHLSSAPGQGTRVTIELPLQPER